MSLAQGEGLAIAARMLKSARIVVVLLALFCPRLSAAAEVTLAWDPPADGLTAGYLIFVGTAPQSYSAHVNVGNATSFTLSGLSSGATYYFTVRAYSASGALSAPSNEIQATAPAWQSGTSESAVSLLSPQPNSTVSGTVLLSAAVAGNPGGVSVWFLVDGHSEGAEDTSAPYQTSWNSANTANGQRTIHAVARDALGNTTISAPITVTVQNSTKDTSPPTVSVHAPATNATAHRIVTISADATDNVGVVSVQFTLNGVNLGAPDTVAPYAINWNTTGAVNGNHAVRAIARDAAGNVATSAVRIVAVTGGTGSAAAVADAANCATPDPFIAMGGGTCVHGGWLPPGTLVPAGSGTPPPAPAPPPVAVSTGCSTPDPFGAMGGGTCVNGGWLPSGMFVPAGSGMPPPATPAPAPPHVAIPTSCSTPDPFAAMGGGTCAYGGWLPPGMFVPVGPGTPAPATPAPPPLPVVQPSPAGCPSVRPGIDWVCRGNGWLPPDHPAAR